MAVVPASSAIWTGVPVVALSRTCLARPDVVAVTLVTAAVAVVTLAIDAVAATSPTDAQPVSLRPTMER